MNCIKTDTLGVDTPIKRIQTLLHDVLSVEWNLSKLDVYGRVYNNKRNNNIIPEYYLGNKEYKEVLLNDNREGIIFFNIGDSHVLEGNEFTVDCEIIFSLDLEAINGNEYRSDTEVHMQCFELVKRFKSIFDFKSIETGLENVYSNYRGVESYFKGMQVYHHFKIIGKITYTNTNC